MDSGMVHSLGPLGHPLGPLGHPLGEGRGMMDECTAALVLMSLSCSPHSPGVNSGKHARRTGVAIALSAVQHRAVPPAEA